MDPQADLFMPGDVWYVDRLQQLSGSVESKTAMAYFVPVIIVAKGNPKGIAGLRDLFREDVSAAVGNPRACQIGRITGEILAKEGLDVARLKAKQSLTVNELGVWVKSGNADAAIVWDAIAANVADSTEVIEIPKDRNVISRVAIALLTTSESKAAAREFIAFAAGPRGREILAEKGYRLDSP
jgi:molybdate transport system substrate-binding protein